MRGTLPFCKSLLILMAFAATVPVAAQDCDRTCLETLMEQFLEAQLRRDASGLPLAPDMRYAENGHHASLHTEFEPVIYWFVNSCPKLSVRLAGPSLVTLFSVRKKSGVGLIAS